MRIVEVNGKKYNFYTSIKDTPEIRWQKAQSFLLYESGVGSSLESINQHYAKIMGYLDAGTMDLAKEEAVNLYFNWNTFLNNISHKTMALLCFVHDIDGVKMDLKTDEEYLEAHKTFLKTEITNGQLDDLLGEIKKKLMTN